MATFEEEMLALLPRLRRFAHSLSRDHADADDLCQVTIEKALKSRGLLEPGTRMDSWMYRIMRNAWIDTARTRTRAAQTFVDEAGTDVPGEAAGHVEAGVLRGDIARAMALLPYEQREAVALVLVEGFAYRQAADVLGVPIGTLTSRLVRGRQALMAALGDAT